MRVGVETPALILFLLPVVLQLADKDLELVLNTVDLGVHLGFQVVHSLFDLRLEIFKFAGHIVDGFEAVLVRELGLGFGLVESFC